LSPKSQEAISKLRAAPKGATINTDKFTFAIIVVVKKRSDIQMFFSTTPYAAIP
jgi:hypothetical protein